MHTRHFLRGLALRIRVLVVGKVEKEAEVGIALGD